MNFDALLKQSDNLIARQLGDDTLLVPINQTGVDVQNIFALNSTAADIWEKLQRPQTVEELISSLTGEYDADEDMIRRDVESLLVEFFQAGFLEEAAG